MKKITCLSLLIISGFSGYAQNLQSYNLNFDHLATRWDEAMPLGNGMLGVLVWQKGNNLRLSLDRADLWDERPALPDLNTYNFKWVQQQVAQESYHIVQKKLDHTYHKTTPSKIPAGAIEFNIASLGRVKSNILDIEKALNIVTFDSGATFKCYVHASQNQGYFQFENLQSLALLPNLLAPNYSGTENDANDNSHAGDALKALGYPKGHITEASNSIRYKQPMYDGKFYEILIRWTVVGKKKIMGTWSIAKDQPAIVEDINMTAKEPMYMDSHLKWWANFWNKSSVSIPDEKLQRQYYLEQYKFGSVARKGAPAITLQAIWTADNGSLPPWKGDFHNDLNTQLSYWPAYSSNHLEEASTFTDWLWNNRSASEKYTKAYFGVSGLNVPGVVALSGAPMGGWIQYSMGPTVGAWCAQHFYWQWKYSMDGQFLNKQAYPFIHQVATYLENISYLENGVRKLPLSSSPEYNNNDISAWFKEWSNFDLGLAKFLFQAAADVALAKKQTKEHQHWLTILHQLPDFESNETGFTIAPGQNLNSSHRHMSQYMAIYPLCILDYNKPEDKLRIDISFKQIEEKGTREWCGYSFSWMASLYARAFMADKAVKQLQIFASNFCSPNTFHLNGDQKGGQYSGFTYRPFTLEGNFAFAQGVNELLLQSRGGYVQVFPAVPLNWRNVSFDKLRTEGAFLISASKVDGKLNTLKVFAEKGGKIKLKLPNTKYQADKITIDEDGLIAINLKKGETANFAF